jgi:hypothetical protein
MVAARRPLDVPQGNTQCADRNARIEAPRLENRRCVPIKQSMTGGLNDDDALDNAIADVQLKDTAAS